MAIQTLIKTYTSPGEYTRDARKLAQMGWHVVETTSMNQKASVMKAIVAPATLFAGRNSDLIVRYERGSEFEDSWVGRMQEDTARLKARNAARENDGNIRTPIGPKWLGIQRVRKPKKEEDV
jgi:hypothetical protein